jgi:hypothetical protein
VAVGADGTGGGPGEDAVATVTYNTDSNGAGTSDSATATGGMGASTPDPAGNGGNATAQTSSINSAGTSDTLAIATGGAGGVSTGTGNGGNANSSGLARTVDTFTATAQTASFGGHAGSTGSGGYATSDATARAALGTYTGGTATAGAYSTAVGGDAAGLLQLGGNGSAEANAYGYGSVLASASAQGGNAEDILFSGSASATANATRLDNVALVSATASTPNTSGFPDTNAQAIIDSPQFGGLDPYTNLAFGIALPDSNDTSGYLLGPVGDSFSSVFGFGGLGVFTPVDGSVAPSTGSVTISIDPSYVPDSLILAFVGQDAFVTDPGAIYSMFVTVNGVPIPLLDPNSTDAYDLGSFGADTNGFINITLSSSLSSLTAYDYFDTYFLLGNGATAVPEPTSVAVIGLGLGALAMRRRRRGR